jgi:hypothetical protein
LSSYPYLAGFAQPEDIPLDYYARLVAGRDLPVMVTEGGWSSASLDTLVSSEGEQRRYIERQAMLLDTASATAVFQLTFTDLDLVAHPPPPGSILPLFAHCGLVDVDLHPKAALAAWDSVFAQPLGPFTPSHGADVNATERPAAGAPGDRWGHLTNVRMSR